MKQKLIQRLYRISIDHDKKVKKLSKKQTAKEKQKVSESEIIRRAIINYQ